MMCFRCRGYPKRLRDYSGFVCVSIREYRDNDDRADNYWLCGACYKKVKDYIWGGEMNERVDEPQDEEPEDIQDADERGAVVSEHPAAEEAPGIEEIWDEIRFR